LDINITFAPICMMLVIWLFYAKCETAAELATRVGIKLTQFVIRLIKNIIYVGLTLGIGLWASNESSRELAIDAVHTGVVYYNNGVVTVLTINHENLLVDHDDFVDFVSKRQQFDDYGHMKFEKREQFEDYDYMRFGKRHD
ncbi:uncharacterized protein Dsk, partial [Bombus flavifrons]|uniref:uncharacterized protein Dsk n=1 Tax=Bombus flavifrons TaxID=103934 RepID=UPI003704D1F4